MGASLLAIADFQAASLLDVKSLSRAGSLPHLFFVVLNFVLLMSRRRYDFNSWYRPRFAYHRLRCGS
ncbi:hypothetical protein EMIT0P74_60264 [Pseudomonas sp. IT-P74]